MDIITKTETYCVIGAGPSGLTAAKNLLAKNIPCEILEKYQDIGGIWNINNPHSTVYDNTYTITSKDITAYTDFPFPEGTPDYIHHSKVYAYLTSYCEKFSLFDITEFNTEVKNIEKNEKFWDVELSSGEVRRYKGVIIANGHNWSPKHPNYPGSFSGEVIHSAEYKNPDQLKGKRVLVVGAGNTGCDIAVEAAHTAESTMISMRRGYYFIPKFIFGLPADKLGQHSQSTAIPMGVIRFVYKLLLKATIGDPVRYGLPKPDHKLLESPPIVNNLLPYYVAHGRVQVMNDIQSLNGNTVTFQNGNIEKIDTIIYATGYKIAFPFIDKKYLNWKDGKPDLYLMAFHPDYDNLFIAGLTDGTGGHFPTADLQTQVIANYIRAKQDGHSFSSEIDKRKSNGNWDFSRGIRFIESSRSLTQFELVSFRKHMIELISSATA